MVGLFIAILFLLSAVPVRASSIVINEIYPNPPGSEEDDEYIELYNPIDNEMNISGWKIDDETGAGSATYTIPEGTVITAKGYASFKKSVSNISLNNSGDTVSVFDTSGGQIDSYTYTSIDEGKTIGRTPDGGSWALLSSVTENTSNAAAEPTITSKPTPSTKPTVTEKPTATPKPNPTVKPSLTSKPENSKTPMSTTAVSSTSIQPSSTTKPITTGSGLATSSASTIAGVMRSATIEPSVTYHEGKKETLVAGKRTYGFIAVAAGIFFILGSVVIYRKRKTTYG